MKDHKQSYNLKIPILMIVSLLLFSLLISWGVGENLRRQLRQQKLEHLNINLELLAKQFFDRTIFEDYAGAMSRVNVFVQSEKHIKNLLIINADEKQLFNFQRPGSDNTHELKKELKLGSGKLITFLLIIDLSSIDVQVNDTQEKFLISLTIIIIPLSLIMWWLVNILGLKPLKKVQHELNKSYALLEQRVIDRTRELSDSEKRFRSLVESSPLPMLVIDDTPDANITLMNSRFTDVFGYKISDIGDINSWSSRACSDPAYHQQIMMRWKDNVEKVLLSNSNSLKPIMTEIICANGEQRFVEVAMTLFANYGLVVFTDLTEHHHLETQLRKSEQRYLDLFEHSPDMYVSVDAETTFVRECNQTLADKLNYTKSEIIGKPVFELYHPDCMEDVKSAFQSFVETGSVQNAELQLMKKNGSKVDVNLNVTSVKDNDGKVLYSRSCWIDITKRKQSEKQILNLRHYLQNVLDSMTSVLVGVRPDGRVTHWNLEAERFSGIDAQTAQGAAVDKLLPLLSGRMHVLTKALQELTPQRLEQVAFNINDEQHYADIMVYPLYTDPDEGAVIRIDDITERVRVEEMMVQTEKMLSVGGLAAGMAHEINNPLGGILQGQQNIRRRFSTELSKNNEVAEELSLDLNKVLQYMERRQIFYFLDEIAKAGRRASIIVENMLHFTRKEEHIKPANINTLLDQAVELAMVDYDLTKKYDFRAIDIRREYDAELPEVFCIGAEIQQVILNILRNSAQALKDIADDNKVHTITIKTRHQESKVQIEIEDNGPGMDEETRRRAFEPFFTTKAVGMGTGLGLSVSYFIITNIHAGEMQIESRPGMGTKLTIILAVK